MRDKAHAEDVGRRAWEIYEQSLSYELEPERVGEFLVLDVDSGDYEVDPDNILAGDRLAERQPNAKRRFLMKVGYSAAYGIGARPKRLAREPGDPRAG